MDALEVIKTQLAISFIVSWYDMPYEDTLYCRAALASYAFGQAEWFETSTDASPYAEISIIPGSGEQTHIQHSSKPLLDYMGSLNLPSSVDVTKIPFWIKLEMRFMNPNSDGNYRVTTPGWTGEVTITNSGAIYWNKVNTAGEIRQYEGTEATLPIPIEIHKL